MRVILFAFSGGGAYGAYEAGVLWGMYNTLTDKSQVAYDIASGVSAGSFNTAGASLFAKGDEGKLVDWMSTYWTSLNESSIIEKWPGGIVEGLTEETGILND